MVLRKDRVFWQLAGFGDALLQPIFISEGVRFVERLCELSVDETLTTHRVAFVGYSR
jgi:hypothetical protein